MFARVQDFTTGTVQSPKVAQKGCDSLRESLIRAGGAASPYVPYLMVESKFCPMCGTETEVTLVVKPDVNLKICKRCGGAVSIQYKDT